VYDRYVGVEGPTQHAYIHVLALGVEQEQEHGMLTRQKNFSENGSFFFFSDGAYSGRGSIKENCL